MGKKTKDVMVMDCLANLIPITLDLFSIRACFIPVMKKRKGVVVTGDRKSNGIFGENSMTNG